MPERNDLRLLEKQFEELKSRYEGLSDCILNKLLMLKDVHPKTIRVVFSRHPKLKNFSGIMRKITVLRAQGKKNPRITDVDDVIALTVLCPYATDVPQIYEWIRTTLEITPAFEQGKRDAKDGHRGYHFRVQLPKHELHTFANFSGLSCELQIKTILEEAFDAKSHDLAYKPPHLEVGEELKTQFRHLSTLLGAVDQQSEFLKDLILREKKEVELRRRACLQVFISDCGDLPAELGLDLNSLPDVQVTIETLDRQASSPSKELCKLAAYCAITFDNEYLKELARKLIEDYVDENPEDLRALFGRGTIYWTLGMHDRALLDMETVIAATDGGRGETERASNRQAKNNFVYFTCDWQIFSSGVPESYLRQAAEYVDFLTPGQDLQEVDTIGLYKVIFSNSVEEIDQARRRWAETLSLRETNRELYQKYYKLHEFIAVNRMMKLITKAPL